MAARCIVYRVALVLNGTNEESKTSLFRVEERKWVEQTEGNEAQTEPEPAAAE